MNHLLTMWKIILKIFSLLKCYSA